jgi:hypothetical protein
MDKQQRHEYYLKNKEKWLIYNKKKHMKYLQIRVRSNEKGEMIYPDGFLQVRYLEYLYCDDTLARTTYMLVMIEDKELEKIKVLTDVEEMTKANISIFANSYEPITEQITDEAKVRRLEIKAKIGEKFTLDEMKAIDPADPVLGINYRKRFSDLI